MQIEDIFNVPSKDFCKIVGLSYRHFKRLKQDEVFSGCEGSKNRYWDLTKLIQAWLRYKLNKNENGAAGDSESEDLKAARIRNLDAQSDLRELDYQEQLNNVIRIEEVRDVISSVYIGVRTALNSLVGRNSHQFAAIDNPAKIRELLKKDIGWTLENAQKELQALIERQEDLPDEGSE